MPFGKEMMETVHYEIKLYPLKIHFTWNNLLLFLEVGDFILIKKMRNNSNRTNKNHFQRSLISPQEYVHHQSCDPRKGKLILFYFQLHGYLKYGLENIVALHIHCRILVKLFCILLVYLKIAKNNV